MPLERTILDRVALKVQVGMVWDTTWQRNLEYVPSSVVQGGRNTKMERLKPSQLESQGWANKGGSTLGKPQREEESS
jgi:hypothetical protein